MTEKLKPCPFCGEKPTFDTNGSLTWIFCYHCDSRGSRVQNGRQAKKKAAEAWNRRAEVQDDLISRHSAIEFIENVPYIKEHPNLGTLFREWMTQVIAAQPMQKTGRWIPFDCDTWECSECKNLFTTLEGTPKDNLFNFCPNCGAKMDCEVEE